MVDCQIQPKRFSKGFILGVVIIVCGLVLVWPIMLLGLCTGDQQPCQYHTCWSLILGFPLFAMLIAFRFCDVSPRITLSEHPLWLFRPPRLL